MLRLRPRPVYQSYYNNVTNSNKILMERNIPRAAIHVGTDKKIVLVPSGQRGGTQRLGRESVTNSKTRT